MVFLRKFFVFSLISSLGIASCISEPEFASQPSIAFQSIRYVPNPSPNVQDSIIITISFEDNEGDIGLTTQNFGAPFNQLFFFCTDGTQTAIVQNPDGSLSLDCPNFNNNDPSSFAFLSLGDNDTLPDFEDCAPIINYTIDSFTFIINGNFNVVVSDTFFTELNPLFNNFLVDVLIRENDGQFREVDFTEFFGIPGGCNVDFSGRVPPLSDTESPIEGTIQFGIANDILVNTFRNDSLRFRVQLFDRNEGGNPQGSNIVETPGFMFTENGFTLN